MTTAWPRISYASSTVPTYDWLVLLEVDTVGLFPDLLAALIAVLGDLNDEEWMAPTACPGWSVADVAAHLLGVELGNVSRRRDGHRIDPPEDVNFVAWLNNFNDDWVQCCRRLSPVVLTRLLNEAGRWFVDYVGSLDDLDAPKAFVWWIGPEPVPVWLDVAREFSERWLHQQQIREATGRTGLDDARYVGPILRTLAHSLPRSLGDLSREDGTSIEVRFEGEGGLVCHLVRVSSGWDLRSGPAGTSQTTVVGAVHDGWRLYAGYPGVELAASGDRELAGAIFGARAVIR